MNKFVVYLSALIVIAFSQFSFADLCKKPWDVAQVEIKKCESKIGANLVCKDIKRCIDAAAAKLPKVCQVGIDQLCFQSCLAYSDARAVCYAQKVETNNYNNTVECVLQDMYKTDGTINISGPTIWKNNVVLDKQSVRVNSRLKTAELVDFNATESSSDEVILYINSLGAGDIIVANKNTVAMAKGAVSFIDAKSKLGLTCSLGQKN